MTLISPQLKKMSNKSSTRGGNALSKTSSHKRREVLFLPVLVCVFSTFFFFFFFVLSSPKLSNTFCMSFFVCVLLLWHNNLKVLCVLHSLRGPTPVVVVLFFWSSFLRSFFCTCAFLCVLFVHKTTTKRRPFPNQNSPSREESVAHHHHHHHHHHLVDALPFETPTKFSPKERRGGVCGVCRTTTPPPKKSDVGRARKRHPRDISISTNSSDAFFFVVQSG